MFRISIKEGVGTLSIKYSKSLLVSGRDYQLTDSITLHHPTIGEILEIDKSTTPDDTYWMYVQILMSDPYSNMVMLDDMGINYLDVTPYDVFVLQWDNFEKSYTENKELYESTGITPLDTVKQALHFFINESHDFVKGKYDDGEICFYDIENTSCQINRMVYEYIYEWIKSINRIDYPNRIKPADENARRILIEDMRDEIKKAKRRKNKKKDEESFDYLGNLMSAASFCGNGAITPFNIDDCKIYWLNESLTISGKKEHANHLLDGLYHGTISKKDIKNGELDWVK